MNNGATCVFKDKQGKFKVKNVKSVINNNHEFYEVLFCDGSKEIYEDVEIVSVKL